jgi:hypothetical protein
VHIDDLSKGWLSSPQRRDILAQLDAIKFPNTQTNLTFSSTATSFTSVETPFRIVNADGETLGRGELSVTKDIETASYTKDNVSDIDASVDELINGKSFLNQTWVLTRRNFSNAWKNILLFWIRLVMVSKPEQPPTVFQQIQKHRQHHPKYFSFFSTTM